jgi:autotransporter family porin
VRGALSAEVGKPFGIYEGWKIEPQGQAIYMHTEYSSFSDSVSSISGYGADALRGRLGARVYDETLPARTGGLQLYAVADVLHDFLMPTALTIGDTRVSEDYGRNWFDVGLGAQYPVALLKNAQLYGNALYRHAFDSAQTYGYQFDAGLKANF